LDLTASMLDPSSKLLKDHCLLYAVSLSFLLMLGLSLHFQLQFNSEYLEGKSDLLKTYRDQITFEQYLLTSKVMLVQGSAYFASFFGVPNALHMIIPMINAFPIYSYYDNLQIYSEVIPNCSTNSTSSGFG
jgi:hypothetical protein